jgi:hypothetical protein
MICRLWLGFLTSLGASAVSVGCSIVVGADFDVHLRSADAAKIADAEDSPPADTPLDDVLDAGITPPRDANADDRNAMSDGGALDALTQDAVDEDRRAVHDGAASADAMARSDVIEAGPEPREEGGLPPTIVTGGFVSLGPSSQLAVPIELRGQMISNAIVRGSTANGITVEGRFR